MRTLIFSDTHLTHEYLPHLDIFLQQLIEPADQVIVNGDFWDAYHTTWQRFSHSRWQKLFAVLRRKKAIVLWGNHDQPRWTKQPDLFSAQYADRFSLSAGDYLLQIQHGHVLAPSFDTRYPLLAWYLGQYVPYRSYSFSPQAWFNQQAHLLMRHHASQLPQNEILITGHSHVATLDFPERYANSGIIGSGRASWLWIEDDKLFLRKRRYAY